MTTGKTPISLLAPRDVARRLNLSTSRVVQLDREGQLPALRDSSGRRFWDAASVEQFAREREARREQKRSLVALESTGARA